MLRHQPLPERVKTGRESGHPTVAEAYPILPARLYKAVAATVKLTFTRDGETGARAMATRPGQSRLAQKPRKMDVVGSVASHDIHFSGKESTISPGDAIAVAHRLDDVRRMPNHEASRL